MIAGQSVLAVIPARGGSKGVPRKNIHPVAGRPLIAWTVAAARASRYVDRLVLSSDDDDIIAVARAAGCETPFKRPADLARDDSPGIAPVLHALGELPGYSFVVLLQPTSPLRLACDIDGCLEKAVDSGAPACVSVRAAVDHPYWTYRFVADGRLRAFAADPGGAIARRQDLPPAFVLNGAVYVARADWLLEHRSFLTDVTVGFEMPQDRSLDIDTLADLEAAEHALRARSAAPDAQAPRP